MHDLKLKKKIKNKKKIKKKEGERKERQQSKYFGNSKDNNFCF